MNQFSNGVAKCPISLDLGISVDLLRIKRFAFIMRSLRLDLPTLDFVMRVFCQFEPYEISMVLVSKVLKYAFF